jgi:hypothetical protein
MSNPFGFVSKDNSYQNFRVSKTTALNTISSERLIGNQIIGVKGIFDSIVVNNDVIGNGDVGPTGALGPTGPSGGPVGPTGGGGGIATGHIHNGIFIDQSTFNLPNFTGIYGAAGLQINALNSVKMATAYGALIRAPFNGTGCNIGVFTDSLSVGSGNLTTSPPTNGIVSQGVIQAQGGISVGTGGISVGTGTTPPTNGIFSQGGISVGTGTTPPTGGIVVQGGIQYGPTGPAIQYVTGVYSGLITDRSGTIINLSITGTFNRNGGDITLTIPRVAPAGTTSFNLIIPTGLRPNGVFNYPMVVYSNSVTANGQILTTGLNDNFQISAIDGSAMAGPAGFPSTTIRYTINPATPYPF